MKLHIAGALELFIDDVIHAAAGVYQAGGDDGQATSLFDVTSSAKEALGWIEGSRINTAGQGPPAGWNHQVVGA